MRKKLLIATAMAASLSAICVFGPEWARAALGFTLGLTLSFGSILLLGPLFKEQLKFSVKNSESENKLKMLLEVQPGRHAVIMRGGHPRYVIEGGKIKRRSTYNAEEVVDGTPDRKEAGRWLISPLWHWWQSYMHKYTGYHPYIPFFDKPHTYRLPRYELEVGESGTEQIKKYVFRTDTSDHVRVETTTWYFEYRSVDIQKVPFLVRGSVQFRIVPGKEITALFGVNEWNVLLDQALNGAVRGYVKANLTLDDVLGETPRDIWEPMEKKTIDTLKIAEGILDLLKEYTIDFEDSGGKTSKKLVDLGIDIQRVEIVDFADELPPEERSRFFAAVIGREEGRANALRGQGTAEAEAALLAAHKDGGDVSKTIIENRALVDASKGSDALTALIGRLARK